MTSKDKSDQPDQMDLMRMDGMNVLSEEERSEAREAAAKHPLHDRVEAEVLKLFRELYGDEQSREEILATDPNDYDLDPSHFYEMLEDLFEVPTDPDNDYFGGYGGTVEDTIAFLTERWDGELGEELPYREDLPYRNQGEDEDEDEDDDPQ